MTSAIGNITALTSNTATITTATINSITSPSADIYSLTSNNATITNLTSTDATTTNLTATNGNINSLTATNTTSPTINANYINPISPNTYITMNGNLSINGLRLKQLKNDLSDTSSMYRLIGKTENSGECGYEEFYNDDNTPSNRYIHHAIQGYNGLKIFNTKLQSMLTHYFDSGIDVSGLVSYFRNQQVYIYGEWLRMFNVGQTSGNSIHFYFGKNSDADANSLHMRYYYHNNEANRFAGIGLTDTDGNDYEYIKIYKDNVNISELVAGNLTANYLNVNNDADITGDGLIRGDLDIMGHCGIDGNCMINGNLTVQGTTIYQDEIEVIGDASITGAASVGGQLTVADVSTFNDSITINSNYSSLMKSDLSAGSEVQLAFGKNTNTYGCGQLGYHLDSTLANSYAYLTLAGMSGLQIYADKVESMTGFECPSLSLNGTDLATTLANCAKLDAANTFTNTQTISVLLNDSYGRGLNIYDSSLVQGRRVMLSIGKGNERGNEVQLYFRYDANDGINNYYGIGFNSYADLYKFYRDRAEYRNKLILNTSLNQNWGLAQQIFDSTLGTDKRICIEIGRTASSGNTAILYFLYNGNNSTNNFFGIAFRDYDNLYKFYRDRVEFNKSLSVPAITLNGTDLDTTLSNCAKLNAANTFTAKQTISTSSNPILTLNGTGSNSQSAYWALIPNLGSGKFINTAIGVATNTRNYAGYKFAFDSLGSVNNYAEFYFNGGAVMTLKTNSAEFDKQLIITGDITSSGKLLSSNFNTLTMPATWDDTKTIAENLDIDYTQCPGIRMVSNFPAAFHGGVWFGVSGSRSFIMTCSKEYSSDDIRIYFNGYDGHQNFEYTDTDKYSRLLTHRNLFTVMSNVARTDAYNTFTTAQTINMNGSSAWLRPLDCYAPNMTAGDGILIELGKEHSIGNSGYLRFQWAGNNNADNYLSFGFNHYDNLYKFYRDHADFTQYLNVSLTYNNNIWTNVIKAVVPDLPSGSKACILLGRGSGNNNSAFIAFNYAGVDNVDSCLSIHLAGYAKYYKFYRDRVIFDNGLSVPSLSLNGTDLATTLSNCAKLDTANTFTTTQTINPTTDINWNEALNMYDANLSAGHSIIYRVGKSPSNKNEAYAGFEWNANSSDLNCYKIGFWGAPDLFRFYPNHVDFNKYLIVPAITLNGTDLATTLSNCAKLDTANTFTAAQTITARQGLDVQMTTQLNLSQANEFHIGDTLYRTVVGLYRSSDNVYNAYFGLATRPAMLCAYDSYLESTAELKTPSLTLTTSDATKYATAEYSSADDALKIGLKGSDVLTIQAEDVGLQQPPHMIMNGMISASDGLYASASSGVNGDLDITGNFTTTGDIKIASPNNPTTKYGTIHYDETFNALQFTMNGLSTTTQINSNGTINAIELIARLLTITTSADIQLLNFRNLNNDAKTTLLNFIYPINAVVLGAKPGAGVWNQINNIGGVSAWQRAA